MQTTTVNAIAASAFTALTTLGTGLGYQAQEMLGTINPEIGWTPTIVGAGTGAVLGSIMAAVFWSGYYNPLPQIYQDLTTNRYKVVKRYIAGTGDCLVIRVIDKQTNTGAVLKLADSSRHTHPSKISDISRLVAEQYGLLSSIDSPNVVRPLGRFKGFGYFILVMEDVQGPTLEEQLNENGPLDFSQTLEFALAMARGLQAIHAQGCSFGHGVDYSQNIILHPEKKAVLIDPSPWNKSQEPRHEMPLWAKMVNTAIMGWRDENKTIDPRLQAILDRAEGKPGLEKYENYDALIRDIEALTTRHGANG